MTAILDQIRQFFSGPFTVHIANALLLFAGAAAIGFLIKLVLNTAGRKVTARTRTELDDRILQVLLPRVKWLTIVIGLYLAAEELAKGIAHTDKTGIQLIAYVEGMIYLATIGLVAMLSYRLADVSLTYAIEQHAHRTSSRLDDALLPTIHRLVMIVIFLIAAIMALGHFGVDVSSLLVFLGGSSVAIALAAQDTLQNMIAGFVIMLDRPFRIGDRIKLPSGEVGDVYEIGLRSTKVLDFDNNLIVSPNSELVKTKVINYSYPRSEVRVLVEVGVSYGTPVEKAREIMLGIARRHQDVLKHPDPEVFVVNLTDSACVLNLAARTDDWKKKFRAETQIREEIYRTFLAQGITPGHPERVVHLVPPASNAS